MFGQLYAFHWFVAVQLLMVLSIVKEQKLQAFKA